MTVTPVVDRCQSTIGHIYSLGCH